MVFNAQSVFAKRIGGESFGKDTTEYKFAKIKRGKREFRAANPDVELLDFSIGEHDGMAPAEVQGKLRTEVGNWENRGYADNGIEEFQIEAAGYLNRTFGLSLPTDKSAAKNIIHSIGGKGALSILPTAFVDAGDAVVMTIPGYPVFGTHSEYLGGKQLKLPLTRANNFQPSLKDLEGMVRAFNSKGEGRVKAICFNFPNNPTGVDVDKEFWKRTVDLAHRYNFVIVHDAAYAGWKFDGTSPTGVLQVDGGMDCGLQVHSMSKISNMIGYRMGFVAGGEKLIAAYGNVKDNTDSGQFAAIQKAAAVALQRPEFTNFIATKYQRRLTELIGVLNKHGFEASMPAGTFYLYTRSPTHTGGMDGKTFGNAEEASQYLLKSGISTVPWDDAGAHLRWAATYISEKGGSKDLSGSALADKRVMAELDSRLAKLSLGF